MLEAKIESLIKKGEGLHFEFKECNFDLSKNIFETVCAFLNRSGGELLLGVDDAGKITGVKPEAVAKVRNNFVVAMNNPQKISPPFYLSIEEAMLAGKSVLYIHVPESSQVHRCNNRIFDRNEDGDFDITDKQHQVSALYLRKQTSYSENRIYPFHREFTNPFPAKFVIDRENFYTENSNKPHNHGIIDPTSFSPCPKNPAIARVFREIGRADELGSGVRKLFKYCKAFCGSDPQLIEGDVFRFILPLKAKATEQVGTKSGPSRDQVGTKSK